MIDRLQATLACDVRLQFRNGFYYATLAVTLLAVLVVLLLPAPDLTLLLPAIIVNNIIIGGFYFLSGLVLLEKAEGSLEAQIVTPLRPGEYLGAKVATLTFLSLCENLLLAAAVARLDFAPGPLIAGIVLGTALYALAGFVTVARYDAINAFLMPSVLVVMLLGLPLLPYFGVGAGPLLSALLWLHPLQPILVLLSAALTGAPTAELAAALVLSVAWVACFAWLAARTFHRFVVEKVVAAPARQPVANQRYAETAPSAQPAPAGAPPRTVNLWTAATGALGPIDARSVQRDEMLRWLIFAPLLLAVVVRWVLPVIFGRIEQWLGLDASPYYAPLFGFVVLLMTPYLWGTVVGFLLLDQRDDQTLVALQVTPLSARAYLVYRLVTPALLGALTSLVVLPLSGLYALPWWAFGVLAVSTIMIAPLTALALATLAQNKVQGLALLKVAGLVLFPPVIAYFLAAPWNWLFAVMPTWWPGEVLWRLQAGDTKIMFVLAVGLAYQAVLLWLLARRFDRIMHR